MWIEARQAARADPNETAARLLAWIEADPYGFCHDLEKDAAKVLNKAGLAALIKTGSRTVRGDTDDQDGTRQLVPSRCRLCSPTRTQSVAPPSTWRSTDVETYVALTQETGLTAADCRALATMLVARRKSDDALAWVERGIKLVSQAPNSSMAGYELSQLKRVLLAKQGRGSTLGVNFVLSTTWNTIHTDARGERCDRW